MSYKEKKDEKQKKEELKGQKNRFYLKATLIIWGIFVLGTGAISLYVYLIMNGTFGELPSTDKLENPETPIASEIYTKDGELIGKFYNENRSIARYEDLHPSLVNALIATEDVRFYKHSGIDFWGLVRVAVKTLILGQDAGGGSTISQQLAKNLFPRKSFGNPFEIVTRKLKEWVIAVRLERYYTKEEIITMYFNTVDFGSQAFGIKSASKTYFNCPPDSLQAHESAVLVGLLKATYQYSPVYNPENSKERRDIVLTQMKKYDYISDTLYDSLESQPIDLEYQVSSHNTGTAQYFREHLRQELTEFCTKNGLDLYSDGLKIYTTLDSRLQRYAEEAVKTHLSQLQETFYEHWEGREPWGRFDEVLTHGMTRSERYRKMKQKGMSDEEIKKIFKEKEVEMQLFSYDGTIDTVMTPWDSIKYNKYFLHTGFLALDNKDGSVRSWVGGINYRFFQYDHVNKRAKRQVGSTFKPFVFTMAAMNGYSPCFKVPNVPVVFPEFDNWSPKNSDGKYGGMVTLKHGLENSINCVTAYIMKQVGPESVIQLARKMGIESPMEPYPSIALGTPDISVIEMVSAFNTFNNKGVWSEPTIYTEIQDKNGNVLRKKLPRTIEVLDESTNYIMLDMLRSVVNHGTAVRLKYRYKLEGDIAGKTGTTQNNSDGWFIGLTPNISAGCWVGAEDRAVHFRSTSLGQGANMALPIFAEFLTRARKDKSLGWEPKEFEKPQEELPVEIDCSAYESEDGGNNGSSGGEKEFEELSL